MPRFSRHAFLALVILAGSVVVFGGAAWAQSKFCPTTSTVTSSGGSVTFNIQQISGNCTNPRASGRVFRGRTGVTGGRRPGGFVNRPGDLDG